MAKKRHTTVPKPPPAPPDSRAAEHIRLARLVILDGLTHVIATGDEFMPLLLSKIVDHLREVEAAIETPAVCQ